MTDEIPTDLDLGIDVATAPELEDSELGAVLEALLLVVDTPVTVDQLAAVTEQPTYRVAAKLQLMADLFNALNSNAAVGATSNAGEPPAAINTTYSTNAATSAWLKPLNILQARYVKFGAQLTF